MSLKRILTKIIKTHAKKLQRKNDTFVITNYSIRTNKIAQNKRFVLLSDLHTRKYGENNDAIAKACKSLLPDMIFLAGDMISVYDPRADIALNVMRQVAEICPTYYIYGNHETASRNNPIFFKYYEEKVKNTGVVLLSNQSVIADNLLITGVELALTKYTTKEGLTEKGLEKYLAECECNMMQNSVGTTDNLYKIMLTHTPEFAEIYYNYADLILCGHFHGGAIKLFGKPLVNPNGSLFPKYAYGMYTKNGSTLIVSGGVGDDINFRLNNPAELVVIDLIAEKSNA